MAAVLLTLLFTTECMTLYRNHIKKLTRGQLRHLRQILGIIWQDRVPDVEVLRRPESVSVEALIPSSQLRWIGHVLTIGDSRLPTFIEVLYCELSLGRCTQGGQKLRYKDVIKRHMKNAGMRIPTWEGDGADRMKWRRLVKESTNATELKRLKEYEREHERRHSTTDQTSFVCGSHAGLPKLNLI